MNVDESDWKQFKRNIRRTLRHAKRRLPRGLLYRLEKLGYFAVIEFIVIVSFIAVVYLWAKGLLELSTILSILVADIPVGLVLYVVLERGSARSRHLLDVIELHSARAKLSHLVVHRSDPWNFAPYPDEHYYIVNTKTKKAYWVDDETHDLIKEGLIMVAHRHRELSEITRYFDNNGIEHATGYARGDDLGL